MNYNLPDRVKYIIEALEAQGYEAYIVGGCVRDKILARKPNDYDITTDAEPEVVERIFSEMSCGTEISNEFESTRNTDIENSVNSTNSENSSNGEDSTNIENGANSENGTNIENAANIENSTDSESGDYNKIYTPHSLAIANYGKQHGTIAVIIDGECFEITTFRIDGEYTDNRRPDSVVFTRNLKDDIARRDFTINAMAMDKGGTLIDPFMGCTDLKLKVVRAVGNPDKRFQEDALRILRGVRFAAQLGFDIEEETSSAIIRNRKLLKNISSERVQAELNKILLSPEPTGIIRKYREIIATVIPEMREMFDFEQNNPYHCYDVWEHTLHALDVCTTIKDTDDNEDAYGSDKYKELNNSDSGGIFNVSDNNDDRTLALRLAVLFHDIGKPRCYTEKDGWGHFYGHEAVSAEIAREILTRLKYDNQTVSEVETLIKAHSIVFNLSEKHARRKLNQLGERILDMLIDLERADVKAQDFAVREARVQAIDEYRRIVQNVLSQEQCFRLSDLKVSGNDLIALGVSQGPEIGRILNELLDLVINGDVANERELLLAKVQLL